MTWFSGSTLSISLSDIPFASIPVLLPNRFWFTQDLYDHTKLFRPLAWSSHVSQLVMLYENVASVALVYGGTCSLTLTKFPSHPPISLCPSRFSRAIRCAVPTRCRWRFGGIAMKPAPAPAAGESQPSQLVLSYHFSPIAEARVQVIVNYFCAYAVVLSCPLL